MLARFAEDSAMSVRSNLISALAVASLGAVVPPASAADEVSAPPPVQALWKEQKIAFRYQSFTTFYTCSGLESKLKRILLALGARRDTTVRARGCISSNDIDRMPLAEINAISPVEATPEALAELDKSRSTRELAARVRGDSKQAEIAALQFPAQWREVSLSRARLSLEAGDCELVRQLLKDVLPKLAVKVVREDVRCAPNQPSLIPPTVVVEALFPLPEPGVAEQAK